jgi:hypothetical protein
MEEFPAGVLLVSLIISCPMISPCSLCHQHAGTRTLEQATINVLRGNSQGTVSHLNPFHSSNSFELLDSELHHQFAMVCLTQLILFAVFYNAANAVGPQQIFLSGNDQENVEVFWEDLDSSPGLVGHWAEPSQAGGKWYSKCTNTLNVRLRNNSHFIRPLTTSPQFSIFLEAHSPSSSMTSPPKPHSHQSPLTKTCLLHPSTSSTFPSPSTQAS